jgi:hypothetical protein
MAYVPWFLGSLVLMVLAYVPKSSLLFGPLLPCDTAINACEPWAVKATQQAAEA